MSFSIVLGRLNKWATGTKAPPTNATLIITERCELTCIFCRGSFRDKNPDLYKNEFTEKEWIEVVKDGVKLGIKEWSITGGEPFVKTNTVLNLIRSIKEEDPSATINISTSGSSLTLDTANKLVELGCNKIEVGIDSPDDKTHDFLRGIEGSYRNAVDSIKYLAYSKKKFGKEKPIVILKTILTSKNYDKLPEMVELCHSIGANSFEVIPLRIYEENRDLIEKNKLTISDKQKKEMNKIWDDVKKVGKKYGIIIMKSFIDDAEEVSKIVKYQDVENDQSADSINSILAISNPLFAMIGGVSKAVNNKKQNKTNKFKISNSINQFLSAFCYAPFYSIIIDPNGNVSPCPSIPPSSFGTFPSMSLRETKLAEIWYGDFFDFLRNLSIEGKPISHKCKECGLIEERKRILEIMKGNSEGD